MDSFDTCSVEGGAVIRRVSELLFVAVDDGCVAKGRVLRFIWDGVALLEKEVFDVILDGQTTGAFEVVPGKIDAGEAGAVPVLGDFVMFGEGVAKVVGVAFVDVFYDLGKFKGCCRGADVAGKGDAISADGDARAVGIALIWADLANHFGVSDF